MTESKESDEVEEEILKVDRSGRIRVPKARREALLDAFEGSGMSGSSFARQHGIHVQTFAGWIQKRRRSRGDYEREEIRRELRMSKNAPLLKHREGERKPTLDLIEVEVESTSGEAPLEVVVSNGLTIRITSRSQLGLLKTLISELQC